MVPFSWAGGASHASGCRYKRPPRGCSPPPAEPKAVVKINRSSPRNLPKSPPLTGPSLTFPLSSSLSPQPNRHMRPPCQPPSSGPSAATGTPKQRGPKASLHLRASPRSIHHLIPPFFPPDSALRRHHSAPTRGLAVQGRSARGWDEYLTVATYPSHAKPGVVVAGPGAFAVGMRELTGHIFLYDVTFQEMCALEHAGPVWRTPSLKADGTSPPPAQSACGSGPPTETRSEASRSHLCAWP